MRQVGLGSTVVIAALVVGCAKDVEADIQGQGVGSQGTISAAQGALPKPGDSFAPGSLCGDDGWCWHNPLPRGDWQFAVGGAGREVWIGGSSATVLHFDGRTWAAVPSPLGTTQSIWAVASDDVWMVGRSAAGASATSHWDGRALVSVPDAGIAGGLNDVWGSGPRDVYAVGYNGVQHFDGRAWTAVPGLAGGSTIGGSGARDVWIGAGDGLSHFDGDTWTRSPELEGKYVTGVAVAGRNDVWAAVMAAGVVSIEHFNGSAWTVSYQITDTANINVWGIGTGGRSDVWVVGTHWVAGVSRGYLLHFNGTAWAAAPDAPTSLSGVKSVGTRGDFAVGPNGGMLALDARATPPGWTDLRAGSASSLRGVWGSAPGDMWAVGDAGTALHDDGRAVSLVPTGVAVALADVWGTGPADVWAVGDNGTALHFDGKVFAPVATGVAANLSAVFSAGVDDVWVGGESATLLHWNGVAFQPSAPPGIDPTGKILDLHGAGANDVWLSGSGPGGAFVSHFDGAAWSAVQSLNTDHGNHPGRRIWELAPNDVWLLTQPVARGFVDYWHFDGSSWTEVFTVPTAAQWMFPMPGQGGSFAFSATDRWFVGPIGAWQRSTSAP